MKSSLIKNSLGYDSNLYVYQDKDMFNYSVDTILLGNFVSINRSVKKMLEIGTNNGALAIFMAERSEKLQIDALEIQARAAEIAKLNLELNHKEQQINIINGDFNVFYKQHNKQQALKYDAIVCNPPFYKVNNNLPKKVSSNEKLIATHEIKLNLEQIIQGSAKIIKQKGYLAMVMPIERMVDCLELMRKYKFEPKRIQLVFPRIYEKAKFFLVEARFQSGWGTKFETNIYLHPEDSSKHEYLPAVVKLYKPQKIKQNKDYKNEQ
ncbi:tRNA1(Val) (adenine(37)-N6)-methyltransferase [Candidatus Mycoplasma pogonae]